MIILDYREKRIVQVALNVDNHVEVSTLPIGDILIPFGNECAIIERKESHDFIDSIKNSRLWDQLARMVSNEKIFDYSIKRKVLIIHGNLLPAILSERISWASVFGALMEIVYVYGIYIFQVETDHGLEEFLRIFKKREEEGKNDLGINVRWERKLNYKKDDFSWKIYILSSIPYVGDKTARKLLEKFGTIEKISKANIGELMKVEGIGKEKAKLIYRLLH
ncbi:MAG: helix-hairpin-helix domain-containing protein [Thermoplasmata archaeon]